MDYNSTYLRRLLQELTVFTHITLKTFGAHSKCSMKIRVNIVDISIGYFRKKETSDYFEPYISLC